MSTEEVFSIRRARPDERPAIVELCRETLRWDPGAPNQEFFSWKHDENPFGRSPMWIAVEGDRILGLRAFLRWQFRDRSGRTAEAVRAVDTVTHPSAQGRGIFTRLTLTALEDLSREGVDFVFNTPNDQSLPGYLKMGWSIVGRAPVGVHPRSLLTVAKMLSSRTRAEKWSQPTDVGIDAAEFFGNLTVVPAPAEGVDGWVTRRTPEVLRWRYAFGPLHYRVLLVGSTPAEGAAVFRLHRRGTSLEATVVDTFGAPIPTIRWRRLLRDTGADYLVRSMTGARPLGGGFIPLARAGPILTQRHLPDARAGATDRFALTLSDVELF